MVRIYILDWYPQQGMAPRKLIFPDEGDLDEFLFTYELVEMRGTSVAEMALAFPAYHTGKAFKLYSEEFWKKKHHHGKPNVSHGGEEQDVCKMCY